MAGPAGDASSGGVVAVGHGPDGVVVSRWDQAGTPDLTLAGTIMTDAGPQPGLYVDGRANIAGGVLLLRPETLRAAILFRAMVPLVPEKLPHLSSARVWIGAGNQDPIIPTSETQRLVELLRGAGADVTIRFFDAGHNLTNNEIEIARDWLMNWP